MSDLVERLREGCPASNDVDCLKERCKAADEIERLKAELFTMRNVFHQQDAEIERLKGDLQVTRLQRDARMVSEFVVDDAVKAEIKRLQAVVAAARDTIDAWPVTNTDHPLYKALAALEGGDE